MLTQKELSEKKYHPMPPTKVEAFWRQFPWAKKHFPTEYVGQVYVSMVEPDLLHYRPEKYLNINEFRVHEQILLLDKNYQLIEHKKVIETTHKRFTYWGPVIKEKKLVTVMSTVLPGWTIYHTLAELEERANEICAILSYFEKNFSLIFYKIPEGLSMFQWVQKQVEREEESFKKTCSAIDSEASV